MGDAVTIYLISIAAALFFIDFIVILEGIKNDKYIWFYTGIGALLIGFIVMHSIVLIGTALSR